MPAPAAPWALTPHPAPPGQATLDDLGTPLPDVTFVVVDLETTGGAPADAGITEVGAVRIRGGEVLGEFQTLVDPGVPVPAFVAALTGITDRMLAGAPRLASVLPAFLEFARGCVLVAHNAPYDVSFLQAACRLTGTPWPGFPVLDTARLARRALLRDEVRDCKLATLARHFRAGTTPSHRALDDARATVDVLHGLLERLGSLGVHSLEDALTFSSRVTAAQRRKRSLAEGLPDAPGVYVFEDARGHALYVGTSRSLRSRVRTYFTATEQRRRMAEMVALAERVVPIVCATPLEAEVRELRLIAERRPRYNRRSRFPQRQVWLKLTAEPFPRLSVVSSVRDDADAGTAYLGPFPGRRAAELAAEALLAAVPLRTCTERLSPRRPRSACALAELGRCPAPCTGAIDVAGYADVAARARAVMRGDVRCVEAAVEQRLAALVAQERYEDAAAWRDRLAALVRAGDRTHRIGLLAGLPELVAACPTADHGWEIHVVRHGRLAGAARVPPRQDPRPAVEALRAAAEDVTPGVAPAPAGLTEETERIWRWLDSPGVRLVRLAGANATADATATVTATVTVTADSTGTADATDDAAGAAGLALPVHGGGRPAARLAALARQPGVPAPLRA